MSSRIWPLLQPDSDCWLLKVVAESMPAQYYPGARGAAGIYTEVKVSHGVYLCCLTSGVGSTERSE